MTNKEFKRPIEVSNDSIREAIKIRSRECFGAMNIANALAGAQTDSWWLIRNFTLDELKQELARREANQ